LVSMNELLNADYNANNLPKGKLRSITVSNSLDYDIIFPKSLFVCKYNATRLEENFDV
jgi:hypothetical protein